MGILTCWSLGIAPLCLAFINLYEDKVLTADFIIEALFMVDIVINFFKKQPGIKYLKQIVFFYGTSYFIFDLASCLPTLIYPGKISLGLKLIRVVRGERFFKSLTFLFNNTLYTRGFNK